MVDTPIGTNSPNYTLVSGDVGATIFCRVTATNASGSAQAFSNAVGPVAAAGGAVPGITTAPAVTVAGDGASVSCSTGTWTNSPTGYAYQWYSDETPDVAISGATSATYVIDGGVIAPPVIGSTWSPTDQTATFVLSNGNLTAATNSVVHNAIRGTQSRSTGKYYFELTLTTLDEVNHVAGFGLADGTHVLGSNVAGASDSRGVVLIQEGNQVQAQTGAEYHDLSGQIVSGDILGIAADLSLHHLWFRVNGTWLQGDPATDTTPIDWGSGADPAMFPYMKIVDFGAGGIRYVVTINTGASAFAAALPSGFLAWG